MEAPQDYEKQRAGQRDRRLASTQGKCPLTHAGHVFEQATQSMRDKAAWTLTP